MSLLVGKILFAYMLGSLSGSLLVGRLRGVDIRRLGSGNAGGTNALRTQGWRFALAVVLIDIGKGVLAAWIGQSGTADVVSAQQAALLCGFAAMLGHVWPVFHGFRGGKGVATMLGMLLVLWPMLLLPMIVVFALVLTTTGYVGLASMLGTATMLPAVWWLGARSPSREWLVMAGVATLFILFTHRENLRRLHDGTEHRFERARVLARWLS